MCTGLEAMVGSTAFKVASFAFTAISTIQSLSSAASAKDRDAAIAQQNAQYRSKRSREDFARLKGAQKTAFGKGGVKLRGTPSLVIAQTAEDEELEVLNILRGGDVAAESRKLEAGALRRQGFTSAAGTILTGAQKTFGTAGARPKLTIGGGGG